MCISLCFKESRPRHRRYLNTGSYRVFGKEIELHESCVGEGRDEVGWLAGIELDGGDDVGVEQALRDRISMRSRDEVRGAYAFVDAGIASEGEVEPYQITRSESDHYVESIGAGSEMRDSMAGRNYRKCHSS